MCSLTGTFRAWSLSLGIWREDVWHIDGRGIITLPTGGKWESCGRKVYIKNNQHHIYEKKIPVWIKLKSKTTQCACNCHTHNGLFLTPCCTLTHILHYPSIPHDSHLLSLGFDHSLFIALQNTPTQLTHCLVTIMTTDTNLKKITFLFTIVFHSSIAICLFVLSYCVPV